MAIEIDLVIGEGEIEVCTLSGRFISMPAPDSVGSVIDVGADEPIKVIDLNTNSPQETTAELATKVVAACNVYDNRTGGNLDERDTAEFIGSFIRQGFSLKAYTDEGKQLLIKRDGLLPSFS